MWFDLRDGPRSEPAPFPTGEGHWYDSLLSNRLFGNFENNFDAVFSMDKFSVQDSGQGLNAFHISFRSS